MKSLVRVVRSYTAENTPLSFVYPNIHKLDEEAYRGAQPTSSTLRKLYQRAGIRTVVNLRGYNHNSRVQHSEAAACNKLGIELVFLDLKSRTVPSVETLTRCHDVIDNVVYPAFFHCKAGSDRVGLFSTLYYLRKHQIRPTESRQLQFWPYGHLRYSRTGILDYFFREYEKTAVETGMSVEEFAAALDYSEFENGFQALPWFDWISMNIFRQE